MNFFYYFIHTKIFRNEGNSIESFESSNILNSLNLSSVSSKSSRVCDHKIMHCVDLRLKRNSRVSRQFYRENQEATKYSIT